MKRYLSIFGLSVTLAGAANASISFDIQLDLLTDTDGTAVPTDTLALLLADTSGDGFDFSYAPSFGSGTGNLFSSGQFFDSDDDLILWRGDLSTNGIDGLFAETVTGLELGTWGGQTWDAGDALAAVWVPGFNTASTGTTNTYGNYTDPSGLGFSDNWITPVDGTSFHKLYGFTENSAFLPTGPGSGGLPPAALQAATVPEPGAMTAAGALALMLMAGMRLLACLRRTSRGTRAL